MIERRGFDEHVQLFVAYSARVAQLSPAAWDRLRFRCADLDGPAFRALLRRARLAAQPYELSLPATARRAVAPRIIAGASRAVQASIAFAGQIAAEFEAADRGVPDPPRRRTHSTGQPGTDVYIDATFLIETALMPFERTNPGLVTALRAAGQAVLRHDWLSQSDFDAMYALVEPEIPFAELAPPSSAP